MKQTGGTNRQKAVANRSNNNTIQSFESLETSKYDESPQINLVKVLRNNSSGISLDQIEIRSSSNEVINLAES